MSVNPTAWYVCWKGLHMSICQAKKKYFHHLFSKNLLYVWEKRQNQFTKIVIFFNISQNINGLFFWRKGRSKKYSLDCSFSSTFWTPKYYKSVIKTSQIPPKSLNHCKTTKNSFYIIVRLRRLKTGLWDKNLKKITIFCDFTTRNLGSKKICLNIL